MTIPNTARKAGPLLGTGSQTAWPFTFKVFAAGDVQVTIANSAGTETLLVLGTDYTVTLNSNQETSPGGTVNYPISGAALPVGSVLAIIGDLDYDQPLDLPSGGNFSPTALENQLDRSTMQIQQLREEMNRTAKLPPTSTDSVEALVDDLQRIADSADNLDTVADNIADITTVADDLNEPVSEINTVATSITNVNAVGSNITNVNTVAGISANVTTVAGIAANVTTVAGISTNVTTVAGVSAAVTAVAAIDDDVTIAAANVADITNFADVYQGAKTSDPALRNDGNALQAGDLYFNTTNEEMRVYGGTLWKSGFVGTVAVQNFSGNGSTTAFTLTTAPGGENNTQIFIGGVYQQKDQYSVSGTTLTFSTAPTSGSSNIEVVTISTLALGETDAALVNYTSSFAGSVATTIKNFLDRIISLGNGSTSQTDGSGNTITGSPRWFIGNNAPSTDNSALLIGRGLTGSYSSGAHAVRDETTYNSSGAGLHAYASFDAIPTLGGSVNYNHLHAFQARPAYTGSGGMDQLAGFTFQANHTGSGTVTSVRGFRIEDCQGAGPITNQYGIWIDPLTRGASNFAIYSSSSSLPSYHGGRWQMGTAPQIDVAGFKTAYGGLLSVDTSGNILPNPNLTIVNGLLDFKATSGHARLYTNGNIRIGVQQASNVTLRLYAPNAGGGYKISIGGLSTSDGTTYTERLAVAADTGHVTPGADNTQNLGSGALRFATVYAGTGTINTSDQNAKQQIAGVDAAVLRAWAKVQFVQFKFNEAVERKADGARWHFGVIAQQVKEAFESEGLDAFKYGLLCFDEWGDVYEDVMEQRIVTDENGLESSVFEPTGEKRLVHKAGQRYGIRYEEALILECAYLRSRLG